MKNRKKILSVMICGLFLAFTSSLFAANLADLTARMPAQNSAEFNKIFSEMVKLDSERISGLCMLLFPSGSGDDSKVRYALNGLAKYVSRPDAEEERRKVSLALTNALDKVEEDTVKAFIIRQIQVAGGSESIDALSQFLTDERLCEPATQAMLAIGTPNAADALLNALPSVDGSLRITIVKALGELQSEDAADQIKPFASSENESLRDVALYALANIGDPSANEILAEAANTDAVYARAIATSYYIHYAKRLGETGEEALSKKILRSLITQRTDPNEANVQSAALSALVTLEGESALPDLLETMDSPSKEFRMAALKLASSICGKNATQQWIEKLKSVGPTVKAEIITMLGKRGAPLAFPILIFSMKHESQAVRTAAIGATFKLGKNRVIPTLLERFNADITSKDIATIQENWLRLPGMEAMNAAAEMLPNVPADAQKALLAILSERHVEQQDNAVYAQTKNKNQSVRIAAINAMANVGSQDDLPRMTDLILAAQSAEERKAAQQSLVEIAKSIDDPSTRSVAVIAAMEESSDEQKGYLLDTLSKIGGDNALQTVMKYTRSETESVQDAAIASLSNWPDIAAADDLFKIIQTAGMEKHKDQALRGYIRIVNDSGLEPDQKVEKFQNLLSILKKQNEKKQVLEGLSKIRNDAALKPAVECLSEESLREVAASTIVKIACPQKRRDTGLRSPEVYHALEKVIETAKDEGTLNQAKDYFKTLPEPRPLDKPNEEGFVYLFNNYDLTGWIGDTKGYIVEDGVIVCKPGGNLYTKEEYGNFIFRFEFQLTPGANNGLGIRTPARGNAAYQGMELQIIDNTADVYKNIKPWQKHGSVYGIVPAKTGYLKPVGEWNTEEVIAKGRHITVKLNGTTIVDANLDKASTPKTIDGREHPGLKNDKGHIGFLGHGSVVKFRNIRIKELN